MKKLSILIALILCVTIGGVYATWVYSQSDDVADITGAKAITMTEATFTGTYGTYNVDTTGLTMVVYAASFTKLVGSEKWTELVPLTKGTADANNYSGYGSANSFNTDTWLSDTGKSMKELARQ